MIIQIVYNIRIYLFVLFCVLAGFTQGLWLLSNENENENPDTGYWKTVSQAFLTSFFYMLGQNIQQDMAGNVSPPLVTLLLIFFMMTMIILMLNILIALMGDAFAKVREKGEAIWRKEQAAIILEEAFLLPQRIIDDVPSHLHVLKYSSDVGSGNITSSSASNRSGGGGGISVDKKPNQLLYDLMLQSKNNVPPFTDLSEDDEAINESN
jgi:transient receptor potential cation channel subfamily V protein 6